MSNRPKVFGIGFHKTATKSLAEALMTLGYRVTGPNGFDDPGIAIHLLPMARKLTEKFDAFQDNPWPLLYREVDRWYPGSKFILTLREPDAWIRSATRYFGAQSTPMRELIYGRGNGTPVGRENLYRAHFEQHNADVRAYFRDRPNDLLELDITAGDGWEKLCPFLDCPTPEKPFPHRNRGGARQASTEAPSTL